MKSLLNKSQFIGLEGLTWFYSGAETPTLKGGLEAVKGYYVNRSKGPIGREMNTKTEKELRENIAKLVNGQPSDVAIMSNSSEAISMVANSLNMSPGDNIVINSLEFPSGVLPSLAQKERGVEVRVVQHENWEITVEDIMEQVDTRTKLVITSHVSYLSGARLDYKKLHEQLLQTNALMLLDATQALGAVPVDIQYTDLLVCSSYKWLLSSHGAGILVVNPARKMDFIPRYVGWRGISDMFSADRFETFTLHEDARKFELGYPSYPTVYNLNYSTGLLLDIGAKNIEEHILTLGDELIDKLKQLNIKIMTPKDRQRRAGNISVVCKDGEKMAQILEEEHIYCWGGDGRLRISIHLFNDSSDVSRLLKIIEENKNYF